MKQFKRITLIAVLLITTVMQSQIQTFNSQVRIKQVPLSSSLDSLVTINSSGLLTYLPKTSLNYLPFTGGTLTGDLIIDKNGTTTNIAESIFTVKKESTLNATNVGQFIDVNRLASSTPVDLNSNTVGIVSRVTNNSIVDDAGVVGASSIGRHSGNNNFNYAYGEINTAEYDGSGNGNFLVGSSVRANVIGTGVGVIDYNRGMSSTALINNPNATVNFLQGYHNTIDLSSGTVGSATVSYLDLDGVGATVTGDLAYIRAGNDALPTVNGNSYFIKSETTLPSEFAGDITAPNFIGSGIQLTGVAKTNVDNNFSAGQTSMDYITTYNGTGFSYISSDRDAGSSRYRAQMNTSAGLAFFTLYNVTTAATLGQLKMSFEDIKYNDNLIYHAGNLDLSNYIEKAAFYEEGTFTPTLTDAGAGGNYTFTVLQNKYVRVGNSVTFTLVLNNIQTTGTPSGNFEITGVPFPSAVTGQSLSVSQIAGSNVTFYGVSGILAASDIIRIVVQSSLDGNFNSALSSVTFSNGSLYLSGTYITNVYTP